MNEGLLKKIEKGLIYSVILSIIIYAVFFFLSDFNELKTALSKVGIKLIIILLLLSLCNYFIRFLRWHLLVRNAGINIKFKDSMKSFFTGLCLTITPGKTGELLKASFVKRFSKASRLKTLPIVVLERLFDLTGFATILLLSLSFVSFESYQTLAVRISIGVFILIILLFLFLKSKWCEKFLNLLIKKFDFLKEKKRVIFEVLEDYSQISMFKLLTLVLMSFLGWFFEVIELHLLFQTFNINTGLFTAGFIFAFSSLIGLLTLTPGGILGFEASSELLIKKLLGISLSIATVITLIIRLTTLWFAVLIGVLTYLLFVKK